MRLADFQVSYQAIPEVARGQGMEHAGMEYRQVQSLIQNRQESVERPNRVIETGQVIPLTLRPIEKREDFTGKPQSRGMDRKARLEPSLYSPAGKSGQKSLDQSAGLRMDMLA